MERELRGSWTDTVFDSGRIDTLILEFTAWLEHDQLTGWSAEFRTERCSEVVRRGPLGPGERVTIAHQFSSGLLIRGVLQCVQTPHDTVLIETPQFSYGFEESSLQTLLGTVVELHHVRDIEPPILDLPPPPPPPPPGLPDEPSPVPPAIIDPAPARGGELFPYVYMTIWPTPSPEELALCFVHYPYPLDAPPSGALVQTLARLRRAGGPDARADMERAAVAYIESDRFVRHITALPAPFSSYGTIHGLAACAAGRDPGEVVNEIFAVLGMDCPAAGAWLDSPEYIAALESVWQSWFAQIIELGYGARSSDALAELLVVDHLLRRLTARCGAPTAATTLVALAQATIVLPAGIFPLPPGGPPRRVLDRGQIAPYAIGELQMVQQRLVGYAIGDIARVESVMAGERRETVHRHKRSFTRTDAHETTDDARTRTATRALAGTGKLSRAIADVLQTTSYGDNGFSITYGTGNPPGTTVSGGWQVETRPGPNGPSQSDVMRSVQRLVEQAADRVARRVVETRTTSLSVSTEDESISVFDNTGGATGRRGIWRWLDEVYEAAIVRYGNRLVFEFLVARPAAAYVRRDADLPADAYPPVPPQAVGIESFEDITRRAFPGLAARYPSDALRLPPPPERTVSGWVRSGTPLTLAVPDGYVARSAVLSYVLPPGGGALAIQGVIGNATVALDVTATGSTAVKLDGETGALQVLLLTSGPLAAPPVALEPVQLSVEISAEPSATAMDAWRLRTYQAIQAAYAAQLDAWQGRDGRGGPDGPDGSDGSDDGAAGSPAVQPRFGWRAIERRELQRGALDLLFETLRERTGQGDSPPGTPRGVDFAQPRQLQFFERTFEWRELSYRFIGRGAAARPGDVGAVGDERFLEFLEAQWAQLLVPVSPSEAMAVLYFLASGMLWDGDAAWIPAHEADVALVSELKKLRPGPRELHRLSEPWEVIIPTTISVLQDGEDAIAGLCMPGKAPAAERRDA